MPLGESTINYTQKVVILHAVIFLNKWKKVKSKHFQSLSNYQSFKS